MTKTEKLLKLASLSNTERKKRRKDDLSNVVIKKFEHGTYICTHHLNQNGQITSKICATITACDCGHVIVEDYD